MPVSRFPSVLIALSLASALGAPARAASCVAPKVPSDRAPWFRPPLSATVIGTGRLQFYSAPDFGCPIKGTFLIPNDDLVVYAATSDGWMSVTYFQGKTGDDSGWVRASRLKLGGTMGPSH